MNVLIATDSFKDSLSAKLVGQALKRGFLKGFPGALVNILPMSDGGEGTVQSVMDSTKGEIIKLKVMDPLMRPSESFYGITGDGSTAIIEMAAASGLEKLKPSERNPWFTTTFGTGELIKNALERGCHKIYVGIGGSATNDCGTGMAEALGVRFVNEKGSVVGKGGGYLDEIAGIDMSAINPGIRSAKIKVACDVSNPLCGPEGASFVYGPQKGADKEMAAKLDKNLEHFAGIIKSELGKDVASIPGSGAAGGLGAGLIAFLDAELTKGFEMVAGIVDLESKIRDADLVITGEGKIDYQTQFGKTPFGVASLAKKYNIPVIAIGGTIEQGADVLYKLGVNALYSIADRPMTLEESILRTAELLEDTGERIARTLSI